METVSVVSPRGGGEGEGVVLSVVSSPALPRINSISPLSVAVDPIPPLLSEAGVIMDPKTLKKSQEVFDELINTEQQFLVNLRVIVDVFLRPLREQDVLNKVQLSNLFSNVDSL